MPIWGKRYSVVTPYRTCFFFFHFKGEKKLYLYQIIENKTYGVDVDKWDYLARDSYCCGVATSFEIKRVLPFMEVRKVPNSNREEICFRESVCAIF